MTFGSSFSGIEAASVAWATLGWKAVWFSEIDPFCRALLADKYPDVPNYGDVLSLPDGIREGRVAAPDVFCGGSPCQAFSVAGKRESLNDDRGNLTLAFVEVADAIDQVRTARGEPPAIVFWENVPGVLSTADNAFGCFLAGLAGECVPLQPPGGGWSNAGAVFGPTRRIAWRILDAQYFGVPQRRRRVYVVASAREGFDPVSVLFESQGVRRNPSAGDETEQVAAPDAGTGVEVEGGAVAGDFDAIPIQNATRGKEQNGVGVGRESDPMYTLDQGSQHAVGVPVGEDAPTALVCSGNGYWKESDGVGGTVRAREFQDDSMVILEPAAPKEPVVEQPVVGALLTNTGPRGHDAGNFACNQAVDAGHLIPVREPVAEGEPLDCRGGVSPTLTAKMQGSSGWAPVNEDAHLVPVAFRKSKRAQSAEDDETWVPGEVANTLNGFDTGERDTHAIIQPVPPEPIAFVQNQREEVRIVPSEALPALGAEQGSHQTVRIAVPSPVYSVQLDPPIPLDLRNALRDGGQDPRRDTSGTGIGDAGDPAFAVTAHTQAVAVEPQPFTFQPRIGRNGRGQPDPVCPPLTSEGISGDAQPCVVISSVFDARGHTDGRNVPTLRAKGNINDQCPILLDRDASSGSNSPPLTTQSSHHHQAVYAVRRLLPLECERLQGFPDHFTAIQYRGKVASDGPRYKALGNSWAVPVPRWIGQRIQAEVEGKLPSLAPPPDAEPLDFLDLLMG